MSTPLKPLLRFWDYVFGTPEHGVVLRKHVYHALASSTPRPVEIGKTVVVESTNLPVEDSYSLEIHGVTQRGNLCSKEIYVTYGEFYSYKVGDRWPAKTP